MGTKPRAVEKNGYAGLIVQLTVMSSERMKTLQDLIINRGSSICISFPRRPESVFDGVEMPVTIILSGPSKTEKTFATTRICRFYTEERPFAFSTLSFLLHSDRAHGHRIAKMGKQTELSLYQKVSNPRHRSIQTIVQKSSGELVYYQEACRYWVKARLGLPRFRKNGVTSEPPHGRTLDFMTKASAGLAVCILNSSLFYWLYSVLSDCEHINDDFVRRFPIPGNFDEQEWAELGIGLTRAIQSSSKRKTIRTKQGHVIEYDEINAASERCMIDEIDQRLAAGFGFTDQELDFIINYDIKYRLGSDSPDDEE